MKLVSLCFHSRKKTVGLLVFLAIAPVYGAQERKAFTLEGELAPRRHAIITIHATSRPFLKTAPVYWDGKFKFKGLPPDSYTLSVFVPRIGHFRQTFEVGPGSADKKGRIRVRFLVNPARAVYRLTPEDRFTVPVKRIAIPKEAWKEYTDAQNRLRKGDAENARKHLEKAVEIAPNFAVAFNAMGTIAYQRKRFGDAETHFRKAMALDPELYEPVVNLGGVLLTEGKTTEALAYNKDAVKLRPNDALANLQLGFNYYALNDYELARRYLTVGKRLDPAHFSNPQLTLFQIHARRGEMQAAAAELQHFLRYHPDYPEADKLRQTIKKLETAERMPANP